MLKCRLADLDYLWPIVSGEVFEKQRNVDAVQEKDEGFNRGVWLGFTFGKNKNETQALAGRLKGQGEALETIF